MESPAPFAPPPPGSPGPLRARLKRPAWQRGLLLPALAVGALFVLLRPTPPPRPPLPDYTAHILDAQGVARSPDRATPLVLAEGAALTLELRPSRPPVGQVGPLRGHVVQGGLARAWRLPEVALDPDGAVRLHGTVGSPFPRLVGAGALVLTLGPLAPEGGELVRALGDALSARGPGWQAVVFPVEGR